MKRNIIVLIAILGLFGITGCSKNGEVNKESGKESLQTAFDTMESTESDMTNSSISVPNTVDEEQASSSTPKNNNVGLNAKPEIDFTYDYSENIATDVDYVVSNSISLQQELDSITEIIQKYTPLAETAQTQGEMNVSSRWLFVIWDTELNNLWSRISNLADQQTKEKILIDQRNWVEMKEEVILENIGSREENGSMYPLLVNSFMEEITKNRAYVLAKELAKIKGESFVMPEISEKHGFFVDNQGTGSVYSSMITRQNMEGNDEAIISIYRIGVIEGTFIDNGNGELDFTSNDGGVKGRIEINGWNGASFTVTETSGESVFSVGNKFNFPFVF